jgi:hypothetical protein
MKALEELPAQSKDLMLPYIVLRPWLSARDIDSVVARVNAAVGVRRVIADIVEPDAIVAKRRPVHDAFDLLRISDDGFKNYIEFVAANENFIPAAQLSDLAQLNAHIRNLIELDRGAAIRLHEPMLPYAGDIAARFAGEIPDEKLHFVLDFEKQNRDILIKAASSVTAIGAIRKLLPGSSVSVSASTFPDTFVGLEYQDIFERQFYNVVENALNSENIIYCDRGSARVEALGGGGGQPAPRIDLANVNRWNFFRVDDADDKLDGFQTAASDAMASLAWSDIGIWGTEYIKRTADRDEADMIDTAAKCTAARINIHLHVQATDRIEHPGDGEEVGWSD